MYSVINVDISTSPYSSQVISLGPSPSLLVYFNNNAIIMGSSTVNEDSAHSKGSLHNYVSFYVRSIKIRYDISFIEQGTDYFNVLPGYVILFKIPYKNETELRHILVPNPPSFENIILYSHPECVLAYDIINCQSKYTHDSHFLNYNKPFIVRPNDYVGICYYLPCDRVFPGGNSKYQIFSTAKVIFKPL